MLSRFQPSKKCVQPTKIGASGSEFSTNQNAAKLDITYNALVRIYCFGNFKVDTIEGGGGGGAIVK